jgi:hypothetical protein
MKTRFPVLVLVAAACGSNPVEQVGTGLRNRRMVPP